MADRQANVPLSQLRKWLAAERDSQLPDADLLARFVANRDEAAFAALVRRHGSMVRGLCQSVLQHAQDAEDACQATFLVLAKKAGTIRKKTSVASWLHTVAYNLAQKMKASRRPASEDQVVVPAPSNPMDELSWREVREIVHEELERLPEKYRQPVILCCIQGRTQEEAARQLGWTAGTLRGMLTRGRDLLRKRLTRRGLALTAPLFVGVLAPGTASAVLAKTTAHAAALLASGQPIGAGISAQAVALAKAGMSGVIFTKLNVAVAVLLTAGIITAGAGVASYQGRDSQQAVADKKDDARTPRVSPIKSTNPSKLKEPHADFYGDPLPDRAVARIGTMRFQHNKPRHDAFTVYSPDGKSLIVNDPVFGLRFWDPATGKEQRRIPSQGQDSIISFAVSPNGKSIVTVNRSNREATFIQVWDFATGQEVRRIANDKDAFEHVAFSLDSKMVAIGGSKVVQVFQTADWQLKGRLTFDYVNTFVFSPDNKTLVAAGLGFSWWDIATGQEIKRFPPPQVRSAASGPVVLSPDGQRIAGIGRHSNPFTLCIWNAATGEMMRETPVPGGVSWYELSFSNDSQVLACGLFRAKRETLLFSAETGQPQTTSPGPANHAFITFSPDNKNFVTRLAGAVEVRDVATGQLAAGIPRLPDAVMSTRFAADGRTLMTSFLGGSTATWDPLTGRQLTPFQAPPLQADKKKMNSTALSADLRKAALMDDQGVLHVWDPSTGKTLCKISDPKVADDDPELPADGSFLVVAHTDKRIRVWDLATGTAKCTLPPFGVAPARQSRALSPDGRTLALAHDPKEEKAIRLYDTVTGNEVGRLHWDDASDATCLLFSADGICLFSGHGSPNLSKPNPPDDCLRLWDIASKREVRRIPILRPSDQSLWRSIRVLALSPSGRTLAVESLAKVILYEWASGQEIACFDGGHTGPVWSIAFAPNGLGPNGDGLGRDRHLPGWPVDSARRLAGGAGSPLERPCGCQRREGASFHVDPGRRRPPGGAVPGQAPVRAATRQVRAATVRERGTGDVAKAAP
jgi:RNA polymerase sigma factor (sigma-70 family)